MRKIVLYGVIIFQILLTISLIRGIQVSRKSSERIASLEATKAQLLQESERIKAEEEYVKSPYYLEKVARDELNLSKPGETVVIVPESVRTAVGKREDKEVVEEKENWRKWWDVLSGRL